MSKAATKTRALTLRPHEARRLADPVSLAPNATYHKLRRKGVRS